ncbi:MAG: hypothetical protein WC083_06800 [Candidatus Methanomethylophilaceae archaeon]
MCLDHLYTTNPELFPKVREGFKVFDTGPELDDKPAFLYFPYVRLRGMYTAKRRRWLVAETRPLKSAYGEPYPSGFHFYLSEKEALKVRRYNDVVHRVLFQEPIAFGQQNKKDVLVARKIFIMERIVPCPDSQNHVCAEPPTALAASPLLGDAQKPSPLTNTTV